MTKKQGKKKLHCSGKLFSLKKKTPLDSLRFKWDARLESRLSFSSSKEIEFASQRNWLIFETKTSLKENHQFVLGSRIIHDTAANFISNRYRDDYSRDKSPEFDLWNGYYEFKKSALRLKLGNQQVAWGEAFGFFYSDIINPKDLRQGNLGLMADQRIPIPMANLQWSDSSSSVQLIWMPFFRANQIPGAESPYSPVPAQDIQLPPGVTGVRISEEENLLGAEGDFAAKMSHTFMGSDVSFMYFNGLDRNPHFKLSTFNFGDTEILLKPSFNRITSYGLSFSTDWEGFILRSENLLTFSKRFNTLESSTFSDADYTQQVNVLGIDFPKFGNNQISFQFSSDRLSSQVQKPFGRKDSLSFVSMLYRKNLAQELDWQIMGTTEIEWGSYLIQSHFTKPVSRSFDALIGVDQFLGSKESIFGRNEGASRVYVALRGAFDG